jgi:hypothetical protein
MPGLADPIQIYNSIRHSGNALFDYRLSGTAKYIPIRMSIVVLCASLRNG